MVYNKLVRDNIPEIITKNGDSCITKVLDNPEFFRALIQKMHEETNEFAKDKTLEELADMFEVFSMLLLCSGHTIEDVAIAAESKRIEKGGFHNKIFLVETVEKDSNT